MVCGLTLLRNLVLFTAMRAGRIIRRFSAKDGRQVVLRTPRWEDLDDLLKLINSLVQEKANIVRDQKVSRDDEIDWLAGALSRLEREEEIYLVAEVDGRVVANSELSRKTGGYGQHVGGIGIAIEKRFRDVGVGTEMMKALIEEARAIGLKVLTLTAFANNKRAIHVYKKLGFEETGKIPERFFKGGKYIDELVMTKILR